MTCELKHFGEQEPKGWDGTHAHPVIQDNECDTAYYESDDNGFVTDTTEYQDTDSDYQSSDDNMGGFGHIRPIRTRQSIAYKYILTDETDYIPE